MKKQIIYSKFIPRLFATTIDLLILSFALAPIMSVVTQMVFNYNFGEFFIANGIDLNDKEAMSKAASSPEFVQYLTLGAFIKHTLILMCFNGILMSFYFIFFWHRYGATPGKMMMKIKIVDNRVFGKPTLWMLIKRFFLYITAPIGVWFIIVTRRSQAMHDKMAGTVVIKS